MFHLVNHKLFNNTLIYQDASARRQILQIHSFTQISGVAYLKYARTDLPQ